jgi:KUP system potassium uptake protein
LLDLDLSTPLREHAATHPQGHVNHATEEGDDEREPVMLRALSPTYAVTFFVDNSMRGFLARGSVFLVVPGSEALLADMGHFGRRPIAIGWLSVVFPALMLNYAGQGATLLGDPATIENTFYLMIPDVVQLPMAVLATAATVIASQALISGAFSLTAQAVQLD